MVTDLTGISVEVTTGGLVSGQTPSKMPQVRMAVLTQCYVSGGNFTGMGVEITGRRRLNMAQYYVSGNGL